MTSEKYYIFYDGECGFCNFWVQLILRNDRKDMFLFAPLQGVFGQRFLSAKNLAATDFETIYLWLPGDFVLQKSSAIIKVAELLGGRFRFAGILRIIPRAVRDIFYNYVSEHRKKLMKTCEVPAAKDLAKFLK